ncbi:MAG TPA: SMC-Scp complex subunit ScpB [Pirellulales bacterium]|nr:SMC-Scp complex subunit ScpB [Pirellulales bacterium]
MFGLSKCAGSPLKSVALRYRHALALRGAQVPHRRPRDSWGSVGDAGATSAGGPHRRDEKLARVEAILFVAREPLTSRKIAQLASLADGTEARTLIRRLNHFYDAQASAFRVEQVAGGYQILTRPKFGGWLRRLHPTAVETRLSAPALETLAVVAYRQPVVRAEIESIRGVQCGEIIRQLIERDLVRITARSDDLGRPFLYGTTKRFLQWLGLRSLDDLPRAATLRRLAPDAGELSTELKSAARRDNELTPRNDLNEESEVKHVATPESDHSEADAREPWKLAAAAGLLSPRAADEDDDEDLEDDEEDLDDEDDDLDDEDDDYEDEDLEDEDLEDEEWEEVDDEDEWEDEDDDDWEEDDEEEEDEEWEDE